MRRRQLDFDLSASNLGFHTNEGKYIVEPGKFNLWVGGSSEAELMTEFEIVE